MTSPSFSVGKSVFVDGHGGGPYKIIPNRRELPNDVVTVRFHPGWCSEVSTSQLNHLTHGRRGNEKRKQTGWLVPSQKRSKSSSSNSVSVADTTDFTSSNSLDRDTVTIQLPRVMLQLLVRVTQGVDHQSKDFEKHLPYTKRTAQHSLTPELQKRKTLTCSVPSQTPDRIWKITRGGQTVEFNHIGWRISSADALDKDRKALFDTMFEYVAKRKHGAIKPRGFKVVQVPADDPRNMGPGAVMAVATENHEANFLLGEYGGETMTQQEYRNKFKGIFAALERQRYAFDLPFFNKKEESLVINAYGINGNETAAINDERGIVSSENARFVVVEINGWPHAFVYTTRKIVKGQEVLLNYGKTYWDFHELTNQTLGNCHVVNGNASELDGIAKVHSILKKQLK